MVSIKTPIDKTELAPHSLFMNTNRTEYSDYKPGMRNIKLRLNEVVLYQEFWVGRSYFYYSQAFNYLVTLIVQTAVKDKKKKNGKSRSLL